MLKLNIAWTNLTSFEQEKEDFWGTQKKTAEPQERGLNA